MISFGKDNKNQLLLNPRISDSEKSAMLELKNEFECHFGLNGYFLIPSSGSTQKNSESVKLIALSNESLLNSAKRFNLFFSSGSEDHWGLVLPDFHIAGLAVHARAFLAGSQVFKSEWNVVEIKKWIESKKIVFMSLVPAQVFDLVQNNITAPTILKKVFVGAGSLNAELLSKAQSLNWPIVETYGMTETASMIAYKKNNLFQTFPEIEISEYEQFLRIKCNSLFTASIQKISGQIQMIKHQELNFYQTQDKVRISNNDQFEFLGRGSDYVKISGEGVSLTELNDKLKSQVLSLNSDPNLFEIFYLEDERRGANIILIVEKNVDQNARDQVIEMYNSSCRPYEKISHTFVLRQIPRTDLGKLKKEELRRIILSNLKKD